MSEITNIQIAPIGLEQIRETFPTILLPSCSNLIDPNDEAGQLRLYNRLIKGTMLAYFIVGTQDETPVVVAIAFLEINLDAISGRRVVNLWNLYGYRNMTKDHYKVAFSFLLELAKNLDANFITAATRQSSVIQSAEELGADTGTRLITWRV